METKHEKFVRLAESRTNTELKKIELLGNLSNRRNYDYDNQEVKEIFKAIDKELLRVKKLFESELDKDKNKFSFSKIKGEK